MAEDTAEGTAVDTAVDEQADGCTVDQQVDGGTADQHKLDHRRQAETDSGTAEVAVGIAGRG